MKKKFLHTLLALVCALCCAFGLVACGRESSSKVKDEKEWKQAIADACTYDCVQLDAYINEKGTNRTLADISIRSDGKTQLLSMSKYSYDDEGNEIEVTEEYYYDGEYVYLNVKEQELGYDWQKMKLELTENVLAPLSYVDKIYSGELLRILGYNITFDGLDKMSECYANMEYIDSNYEVTDGDFKYMLNFNFYEDKISNLIYTIESSEFSLYHAMADYVFFGELGVPTESVQEVGNTNN